MQLALLHSLVVHYSALCVEQVDFWMDLEREADILVA